MGRRRRSSRILIVDNYCHCYHVAYHCYDLVAHSIITTRGQQQQQQHFQVGYQFRVQQWPQKGHQGLESQMDIHLSQLSIQHIAFYQPTKAIGALHRCVPYQCLHCYHGYTWCQHQRNPRQHPLRTNNSHSIMSTGACIVNGCCIPNS